MFLGRPRLRLHSPIIVFKPTAILHPNNDEVIGSLTDPLMASGVPASVNLLDPLKSDPAVEGTKPNFSAARLSRIDPPASSLGNVDHIIRTKPPKLFRVLPAISSRFRCARASGRVRKPCVIASLDIEAAPFSFEKVKLTDIKMELSDGTSEDLSKSLKPMLPLECCPQDNAVFLFRLMPHEIASSNLQTSAMTVLITVHAIILVSPSCRPKIQMRWRTGVDFSTAVNPVFGAPGQSMQRQRRPDSLSRAQSNSSVQKIPMSSREIDSSAEQHNTHNDTALTSDYGLSVTFTGPQKITIGQAFSWQVSILNRSNKPRQLALVLIPTRRKVVTGINPPKVSSSTAMVRNDVEIAEAVVDSDTILRSQSDANNEVSHVTGLSTDIETG